LRQITIAAMPHIGKTCFQKQFGWAEGSGWSTVKKIRIVSPEQIDNLNDDQNDSPVDATSNFFKLEQATVVTRWRQWHGFDQKVKAGY
jgi:hypothetical protein